MAKFEKPRRQRSTLGRDWSQLGPATQALVDGLASDQVAAVIADEGVQVLGLKAVGLWRVDRARGELRLIAQRGFGDSAAIAPRRLSLSAPSPVARAARTKQPVEVPGLRVSDRALASPPGHAEQAEDGTTLVLPLLARGRVIGAISCVKAASQHFTQSERAPIQALGDLWAIALARRAEIEAASEDLREVNQQLTISNVRAQELGEDAEAARDRATRLYEQLQQAQAAREEFMNAAAHELRSPVTVIKGQVQLLLRNGPVDLALRPRLEAILRQADRISQLVDDLMAALRLHPGAADLHRERFDLSALVGERVARIARAIVAERFRIDRDGPLVVDADRALIGEVVSHLLENAVRYSPEDGAIEVAVQRRDDAAVVSVADHGVGISPERQPHVFEPLYELVPPGEPGYQNVVTLGLYLSKEIVDLNGGKIWFSSVPGDGSTFSFSLPLA